MAINWLKYFPQKPQGSNVIKSQQLVIFTSNCPVLACHFLMSKKKCDRKIHLKSHKSTSSTISPPVWKSPLVFSRYL
jgi:hypothetical protein